MIDTPQITESELRTTAVIHLTIPRSEIRNVMGPAIREVMEAVMAQGIGPAGPVFSHHFEMNPDIFDFEVGVPVTSPVTPVGRVQPSQLPAIKVARVVHHGGYEGLGAAWGQFDGWLKAHGHQTDLDFWECYVAGPESSPNPAEWRTELNRPLLA
jgi:effector-binding domain-containing protein